MDIFRVEKNVPDVYVNESRDFQVLLRLLTYILAAGENNAYDLKYLNSPNEINSSLLTLMQGKVGFFTDNYYSDAQIRDVVDSFADVVKYKGSMRGVREAVALFFNALNVDGKVNITVNNYVEEGGQYLIDIEVNADVLDFKLLYDLLQYVVPFGYIVDVHFPYEQELKRKSSVNGSTEDESVEYVDVNNGPFILSSGSGNYIATRNNNRDNFTLA